MPRALTVMLQQVIRVTLRRLRTDAGQSAQGLDGNLDALGGGDPRRREQARAWLAAHPAARERLWGLLDHRHLAVRVDAAAVLVNASTRFVDGEEFGFGAEIGISTQKLHARGPMGLRELTTAKYVVRGDGQVRG